MTATKAVQELARTLRHCPGVVGVRAEGSNGDSTIVLVVTGPPRGGPAVWFGFPVRVESEGS